MSAIDDVLSRNEAYAAGFDLADMPAPPARKLTVVTCMDARIDVHAVLGLEPGEAHVLRNAGGVVTDDTIRSLALSQRALGTEEVLLMHHTRCGLDGLDDEEFAAELGRDAGAAPDWAAGGFADVDESVRRSLSLVRESPFIPRREKVRGFVYDVESGRLREVQ
jgi:carbonic anhydrase